MTASSQPPDLQKFKSPASDWRNLAAAPKQEDETKVARDILKEALLTSLQMQNIVALAGSGTSIAVGGPSMKDLWNAAIGTTPTEEAINTAQTISYELKDQNIEEFLSRAEAYLHIKDDTNVKAFVDFSKRIILEKCSSFLDANKLDAHQTFLHRLSRRRVRDPRLKVFTTNYDLCFEQAASMRGGAVIDGFSFTPPRHYDPRFFGYDIIRRNRTGEDQGNYLEGVFHLYKLHGSVNWARSSNGLIQEKPNPSPEEACLIYPARGKYQQSFLPPHLESMSQYLAALREPNTCIIVTGFGFNDNHLAEPLLASVRSNPHLRLVIADPTLAKMESETNANRYWKEFFKLSKEGEDIWLLNLTFEELSRYIPDLRSLTPADKLMKTIQSVTGGK